MPPILEMISKEEKYIIMQVRERNLLFQSIPLALCGLLGSKQLVNNGIVRQKWLSPMYVVSAIGGLYIGSRGTPGEVKSRLLKEVPDGLLSQTIRATEHMSAPEALEYFKNLTQDKHQYQRPVGSNEPLSTQHSNTTGGYQGNRDVFTQRSQHDGSQDRLSPSSETVQGTPATQPGFSYSKQRQLSDKSYGGGGGAFPPSASFDDENPAMQHSNKRKGHRNQYGDEME